MGSLIKIRPLLPLWVIVAGIFYSLFLLHQIPEGVYFGGDAGLKALLTQQLAQGTDRFDLVVSALPWVKNLWDSGLYPYQPPFVYHFGDRYFITFPYTFPLVTAPFYRLWGYYGLYVVPLLGLWGVWGLFYAACRLLRFSASLTALGLGILIFASPLTLYGAMYWEHSLAVALAIAGGVLILWARKGEPARLKAIAAGIGLGLAVWFRPEFLAVLALAIAIALGQGLWNLGLFKRFFDQPTSPLKANFIPHPLLFSLSALVTTILFFISNQVIYGHYLGIHGIQALEKITLAQKLKNAIAGFEGMGLTLIIFLPIISFIGFYILALWINRQRLKPDWLLLIIYPISILLVAAIAWIVPPGTAGLIPGGKQWGSRFLLILVPPLILATLQALRLILPSGQPWLKYLGITVFVALLGLSFHKNTLEGTAYLKKSYQDIAPAIAFLESQPESAIAINHQFVGQVLQASVKGNKLWFKVQNLDDLQKLTQTLLEQDLTQFLYVCYPAAPCTVPELPSDRLSLSPSHPAKISFHFLGKKGKYPVYQASIHSDS